MTGTHLRSILALMGLSFVATGCVNPPPHAIVVLVDPEALANQAAQVAVSNEAGVFRVLPVASPSEVRFTVVSPRSDTEELLTFEALSSTGRLLARTRGRVFFAPSGETLTYRFELGAVCTTEGATGRICQLDDGTSDGVCVAGRCRETDCGDGTVDSNSEPPEQCDDGNLLSDDDCTPLCQFNVCGDGFRNSFREECDDGRETGNEDGCVIQCDANNQCECRLNVCGDGFVNRTELADGIPVEECDDGNLTETDACLSTCRLNTCGDGVVHAGVEECDDGNDNPNDGCDTCSTSQLTAELAFGLLPPYDGGGPRATGGESGRLADVTDIAWSPPNGLIVVEHGGEQLYRLDFRSGRLTPLSARGTDTSGDQGPPAFATFETIGRVAVSPSGTIAVSDRGGHRVRVISPNPGEIDTVLGIGVPGAPGGSFGNNIVDAPTGVAFTADETLLVIDAGNGTVRVVPPGSVPMGIGSLTPTDGAGLAVSEAGLVFVADTSAGVVRVSDGTVVSGPLTAPTDLAAHPDGRILVVDSNRLFAIDPNAAYAVSAVAGSGATGFTADGGPATSASFDTLVAVAISRIFDGEPESATIYLAEQSAIGGLIRRIDPSGQLETVWGDVTEILPAGLTTDALRFAELGAVDDAGDGRLFVTDPGLGRVYQVSSEGTVTPFAGRPSSLLAVAGDGDGGPALDATLQCPVRVSAAATGEVYIPDRCADVVRVVSADGTIETAPTGTLSALEDAVVDDSGRLIVSANGELRLLDGGSTTIASASASATELRIEQLQLRAGTLYFLDVGLTAGMVASATIRTASGTNYSTVESLSTTRTDISAFAVDAVGTVTYVTVDGALFRYVEGTNDERLNDEASERGDGGPVSRAGFSNVAPDARGTTSMRAIDDAIFVGDHGFGVHRGIQNGTITSAIGRVHPGDGSLAYAYLEDPRAVVAMSDGSWLVADGGRVVSIDDARVQTVLGYPRGTPIASEPQPAAFAELLGRATALARVTDTRVYVTDGVTGRLLQLSRSDTSVPWSVREMRAGLDAPSAVVYGDSADGTPSLFVAEAGSHRISRLRLDDLALTPLAGGGLGFADADDGALARFDTPRALAVGAPGTIYVADERNNRIRRIQCDGEDVCRVDTLLGGSLPGALRTTENAAEVSTQRPTIVSLDPNGNLLVGSDQELALLIPADDSLPSPGSPLLLVGESTERLRTGCFSAAAWASNGETFLALDRCHRKAVLGRKQ